MKRSKFSFYWSALFLTGQTLILTGGFLGYFNRPQFIDRLTFDVPLKEGYTTNAIIVNFDDEIGLQFNDFNQYLSTPIFQFNRSISIHFYWLAFSMTYHDVVLDHVFELRIGNDTIYIKGEDLQLNKPTITHIDIQGTLNLDIVFMSAWNIEGSRILPTLWLMEIYDGKMFYDHEPF